jgi:hypothetical protein
MDRRSFIGAVSTASLMGISGCLGIGGGGGNNDDSNNGESNNGTNNGGSGSSGSGSQGGSTENAPSVTVSDSSFSILGEEDDGRRPEEPEIISWEEKTLTIRGMIDVSNGCMSAELGSAPSQGGTDPVNITVDVVEYKEDDGFCTTAIESIPFELQLTYSGNTPQEVVMNIGGVETEQYTLLVEV